MSEAWDILEAVLAVIGAASLIAIGFFLYIGWDMDRNR